MQPPDSAPPLNMLAWLKSVGFEAIDLPGAPAGTPQWWRRNGDLYSWDETPAAVTRELADENERLKAENAKFKAVTPAKGFFTSEFLLNAGAVLAVGIMAAQGQIEAFADTLGPQAGNLVKVVLAVFLAAAASEYKTKRALDKSKEADAKKQITDGKQE